MGLDGTRYQIFLKNPDDPEGKDRVKEIIEARTPGQAAMAAEAARPGYVAEYLTIRKLGICSRCQTVIFEGAMKPKQIGPGTYLCGEC